MIELYQTLKFLNSEGIHKLELAKFMHSLNQQRLPEIFYQYFLKIDAVHNHHTRQKNTVEYFLQRVNKKFGHNLLAYRGSKIWADIPPTIKNLNSFKFKKKLKETMLRFPNQ